jgi:BCD family chlorophyll transporter-like MFS transporter
MRLAVKTLRLGLICIGIGWMFALRALNFNRISIVAPGAPGVIVTTLIGLHHFLAPFQVFWGRLADRYPLWGYRRTPYIVISALVSSLVFLALPALAIDLGTHVPGAIGLASGLVVMGGMNCLHQGVNENVYC